MTRRQLARTLQNKHAERSWREISQQDYFGQIPAGTLARIAKSNGDYIPRKWRAQLGLGKARPSQAVRNFKQYAEMEAKELLYCFLHRMEMTA